jgi:hypothetical protein
MCKFKTKIYEAYYPEFDSYFYFEELLHVKGKKFFETQPAPAGALGFLRITGGGSLVHLFHNAGKKIKSEKQILELDHYAHFTGPFQSQFKILKIEARLVAERTLLLDQINFCIESFASDEKYHLVKGEISIPLDLPNTDQIQKLPDTEVKARLIGGYALFMSYFYSLSTGEEKRYGRYDGSMIKVGEPKSQILEGYEEYFEITKPYSELSKQHNLDLCRFL